MSTTLPAAAPPPVAAPAPLRRRRSVSGVYYAMLIPTLALFTLFVTLPALVGAFFSLTNYAGFGSWKMVGLENYRSMFSDPRMLSSYGFTLGFAFATTIVVNAAALLLAIGLSSRIRFKTALRGVYVIPMVISGIIIAYVFNYIFGNTIPAIAGAIGWEAGTESLLTNPSWAWLAVVLVTAWQAIPGTMIIYLAGLLAIPEEVYEAAALDGASARRRFTSITFPLVIGYVVINTILCFKNFINAYDIIVGLTSGGPGTATFSVAMTIFSGFESGDYAYQMANAVVFFVVTIVISVAQLLIVRGREVQI